MSDDAWTPLGFPYRLQPPLLTIDIRDVRVSLRLEAENQRLWLVGWGPKGGTAGWLKGRYGQLVGVGVDEYRAVGGWLPSGTFAVEATTAAGKALPVKIGNDVWLAAAPLGEDVSVVFKASGEGVVDRQDFPAWEEPHVRRGPLTRLRLWLQSHRPGALPRGSATYSRGR